MWGRVWGHIFIYVTSQDEHHWILREFTRSTVWGHMLECYVTYFTSHANSMWGHKTIMLRHKPKSTTPPMFCRHRGVHGLLHQSKQRFTLPPRFRAVGKPPCQVFQVNITIQNFKWLTRYLWEHFPPSLFPIDFTITRDLFILDGDAIQHHVPIIVVL